MVGPFPISYIVDMIFKANLSTFRAKGLFHLKRNNAGNGGTAIIVVDDRLYCYVFMHKI